jgi:predicted outer membrane lipoprotein
MANVLLVSAPLLALATYLLWFRKAGFSGFALLFAFIAGPFLALFVGTTVESISDNRTAGAVAAVIGGPLILAILTPILDATRRDRKTTPRSFYWLYGVVIFACAFGVLASFSLRHV